MKLFIITAFLLASAYCSPMSIPGDADPETVIPGTATDPIAPKLGKAEDDSIPSMPDKLCIRKPDMARIDQLKLRKVEPYKPEIYKPEGYKPSWHSPDQFWYDVSHKWDDFFHHFSFPWGKYDRICFDVENAE